MRRQILLFLFPLFLSLPFLNRALFVDDQFFVRIATWLKDNPTRPYDFPEAGEAGTSFHSEEKLTKIVNPLLHHYYLAFLMKMGANKEWQWRLGCVLLSCFSMLFIFELARRWTSHPFLASVLVALTPAFWLSSYSLLIDSTLGFFFFGAIYFFIRSFESEQLKHPILSGSFIGAAMLSKYTAVLLFPLTLVWLLLHWKNTSSKRTTLLVWGIGLLFTAAYSWITKMIYGESHLGASSAVTLHSFHFAKLFVLSIFLTGVSLVPVATWFCWDKKKLLGGILLVVITASILSSSLGGFEKIQSVLLSGWFVTTISFFILFLASFRKWEFPSDYFLAAWLFGFMVMMGIVMQWVAARYFVIVLPALVFSVVRLVEIKRPRQTTVILTGISILIFFVSFSVAYADYQQADSTRLLVRELKTRDLSQEGVRKFYLGEAYTMSDLSKEGWIPLSKETLKRGDLVMLSEITFPAGWFFKTHQVNMKPLARIEIPTHFPFKVMDVHAGAGFYASVWGALPFTVSSGPWEVFHLFQVLEDEREIVFDKKRRITRHE